MEEPSAGLGQHAVPWSDGATWRLVYAITVSYGRLGGQVNGFCGKARLSRPRVSVRCVYTRLTTVTQHATVGSISPNGFVICKTARAVQCRHAFHCTHCVTRKALERPYRGS